MSWWKEESMNCSEKVKGPTKRSYVFLKYNGGFKLFYWSRKIWTEKKKQGTRIQEAFIKIFITSQDTWIPVRIR
jgi:hypothetical protein